MSRVKVGIIGAGRIGKLHAENLVKMHRVELKAISDLFAGHIREWADRIGIPVVTDHYQNILHDKEIQAILICSPTDTHVPIITEAAKAGKHIFCEKPISFQLEQTKQALEAVKETGVKFQVGFCRRFDQSLKKAHQTVKEGKIGQPHLLRITSRDPHPPTKEYVAASGGLFFDMAIHDFDMARYLVGSEVEEVFAQGAVLIDPMFAECGDVDTAVTTLKFSNGAIGVIDNSRKAVYGYDQRVEVFAANGCVTVENARPTTAAISTAEGVLLDKPKYFFLERYNEAFVQEMADFIESILDDKEVPVTGHDGLQAELIARAAQKSFAEKRPVKIAEIMSAAQV